MGSATRPAGQSASDISTKGLKCSEKELASYSPYFMKMTCPALHIERQGNTVKPRGSPRNSLHFGDVSPSPFLTCSKPETLTYRNLAHISHNSEGGPGVLLEIEHLVAINTNCDANSKATKWCKPVLLASALLPSCVRLDCCGAQGY